MSFLKKNLEQGSEQWLDFRKEKVMATDSSIILGLNPWKKKTALWEEKLGFREPPKTNAAMRRGAELEAPARLAYQVLTDLEVEPCVVQSLDHEWMAASLDGLSSCGKFLVEIKCGLKVYEQAANDEIPPYYMAQMQHQMAVCGLDSMHYYCFSENADGILMEVKRDESMIDEILEKGYTFWQKMQNFEYPDNDDLPIKEDPETRELVEQWLLAKDLLKIYEAKEKELRSQIISNGEGEPYKCGKVKVKQVVSKGRVDYAKIPELEGVELDKYRKKPVISWRVG